MYDAVMIGAGPAGLMCAIEAGARGRNVLMLEGSKKIGQKLLISGGGRCNFSNLNMSDANYISQNGPFVSQALAKFNIERVLSILKKYHISHYEKKDGQLFCRQPAKAILGALRKECERYNVRILKDVAIKSVSRDADFRIKVKNGEDIEGRSVVVATGGLSYKRLGSSGLGYELARQFGLNVIECRPGLVPLVFNNEDKDRFGKLSGISFVASVSCAGKTFRDGILITHHGLSGPAILQISSYWKRGLPIKIDVLNAAGAPARLMKALAGAKEWCFFPKATEGYDHAEVTVGGVDTLSLSPDTFECKNVPGLYFIGEVTDVTGQLGGYNIHWAFASGYLAGSAI